MAPYLTFEGLLVVLLKDLPILVSNVSGLVMNPEYSYSWAAFLDPSVVRLNESIAKEAVANEIFDSLADASATCRQQIARALLTSTDSHGREVLSMADASLASVLQPHMYFANRYEFAPGPPTHVSATSVVLFAFDHGLCSQVFGEYAKTEAGLITMDEFIQCNESLVMLAPEQTAWVQGSQVLQSTMVCTLQKDRVKSS